MTEQKPIKIITSRPFTPAEYWRELVKNKGLISVFTRQELKETYAQTKFGILWSIIRPLFTLLVFTIIFRNFLKVPTDSPYYLFAFSGMIAWNMFSQIAILGSTSIVQRQGIIKKMYFPKLILPLAKVAVILVDASISLLILFVLILIERIPLSANLLLLPLFILLNVCCGLAIAIWMNILNIRFRDLNQIVPAIITIGIWLTPVFYPTTIIPATYDFLVYANPLAGIIKGFRFALLGEGFPTWQYFPSVIVAVLIMLAGVWQLIKVEDSIVDYG